MPQARLQAGLFHEPKAPPRSGNACFATIIRMFENLLAFAQPYGGDLLVPLILLAIVSLAVLWKFKSRMDVAQLRRMIRVAALVALLGSVFAMQLGAAYYALAIVLLLWGMVVGIVFGKEIGRKR